MPVHFLNRLGTNPRLAAGVPLGGQTPKRHTHFTHQMGPTPPPTRTTPLRRKGASRPPPGQAPRHVRLIIKHSSKKMYVSIFPHEKTEMKRSPEVAHKHSVYVLQKIDPNQGTAWPHSSNSAPPTSIIRASETIAANQNNNLKVRVRS